ncbi:MAG: hypothetical protein Q7S87_16110 [Agitococcus sp.]|nr:hypothetical protein [Agitococcus sp.]
MERLFAAVSPEGSFEFASIQQKRRDVFIQADDIKYGDVRAKPICLIPFEGRLPVGAALDQAWETHSLAWVFQNEDASYWLDTLTLTPAETRAWVPNADVEIRDGLRVVPVRLLTPEALQELGSMPTLLATA